MYTGGKTNMFWLEGVMKFQTIRISLRRCKNIENEISFYSCKSVCWNIYLGFSCKTFEDDVQCSEKMKIVATNKNHCGYLNPKTRRSSPFNICLASKPTLAKQMFESCIYDVCSYFDDVKKRTEAACRAAEGLEAICETSGFDVQWRSSSFCRKIPFDMVTL